MSLLIELKERRTHVLEELNRVEDLRAELADFDRVIAALEPKAVADEWHEDFLALTDEQPELFEAEKSEAREQLEREDDASEFAEPMPDPEFVVLDEQTCEPVEEAPALNEQMQDEREEPVALAQPEWNEPPQPISMIDEQTCEPVDPTLRAFEDDHIVEPQPTEGYAPVTNPEADALARAHDYYSPEKVAERNKFNPWGGVAHLFGKPKVDA